MEKSDGFDPDCKKCRRLNDFLCEVRAKYPDYYARPVPSFGSGVAKLLIVGLAPGMHGANATGRPFTGDYAGIWLYEMLFKYGFSNRPVSKSLDDGLVLVNCKITNAVKCLPPQNKPTGQEINTCNNFLSYEIALLEPGSVILALGGIAHQAVLKALKLKLSEAKFGHNRHHQLPNNLCLIDSYHSSRYNIQTNRLTLEMFDEVFQSIMHQLNSNDLRETY